MSTYVNLVKAWGHLQLEQVMDKMNEKNFEASNEQTAQLAEEIRSKGVVTLPDYYSEEKCDAVIAEINRLVEEGEAHVWQDETKSDTRLYGSHLYSDLIAEFHNDPFLTEIGERYLKSSLLNSHTLGAHLIPKSDNLGSGGGWHRDSVYKRQYKSIIYLTDVNEENGPFEYLLGTHNESTIYASIKHNGFKAHQNRMSHEMVEDFIASHPGYERKVFTAKRGTVVLVDTRGIHRGMPIQNGERYALTNYFYPKHHYTQRQKDKFTPYF